MEDEPEEIEEYDINKQYKILEEFALNLIDEIKDLDPEFEEIVDNHFWELV